MKNGKRLVVAFFLVMSGVIVARVKSQEVKPVAAATTNPANALGSMTPLRGVDVAVRTNGESSFSEKTGRVAMEAYRDEDFGTLTYISGTGSIASMPQPANFQLRQLPFDRFYETVRFSPIAGTAWRLNLRSAKWQLIQDPVSVLPGNYDIDMFHVTDETMVVMRIDQLTGRTWTMTSVEGKPDVWSEIAEPDAKPAAK